MSGPSETRTGIGFALACYGTWGLFPAFWKLVADVPPPLVLAHRIVWSLVAVLILISVQNRWGELFALLAVRRRLGVLLASTLCISLNWLIFIDAVGRGNVLETSLGYFLNPLVNVGLGVLVLKERLRPWQWLAVALAAAGLVEPLVVGGDHPPWVAIVLALSFGIYGLLRKRLPIGPLVGLAVETGLIAPLALGYLVWTAVQGDALFGGRVDLTIALVAGGPITALPLLWFAAAATRLRYSTLGFFQYIAPTGHFALAVLAYGETPDPHRLVTFICIWVAIALYSWDAWRHRPQDGG